MIAPAPEQIRLAFALTLLVQGCTKLEDKYDYSEPHTKSSRGASTGSAGDASGSGGAHNVSSQSDSSSGGSSNPGKPLEHGGWSSVGQGGTLAASTDSGAAAWAGGQAPQSSGRTASSPSTPCIDPEGFNGLGCYKCMPTDIITLERSCTDASCTPFDNARRLTRLLADRKLPELPVMQPPAAQGGSTGTGSTIALGGASTRSGEETQGGSSLRSQSPPCSGLEEQGTVVYISGSSAVGPFLEQVAQQLAAMGVYIIYTATGSCVGVDAILNQTPMMTGPSPSPALSASYWDGPTPAKLCDIGAPGVQADIGVSDVFAQTCPGFELANLESLSVRDAHGPIQTMVFAVPTNSRFTEISAQAAYFAFGFGADGGILDTTLAYAIWSDEDYLFKRSATSGTQSMIAASIGVPAALWKGKPHKTSDDVAVSLRTASADVRTADKALGILAADYIKANALGAQIRPLAYQDSNQPCAVYPDSTATSHDKRNVRDGHYPIWSPLHLLYRVNASNQPIRDANRQQVLDILGYLSGSKPLPNEVKLLDVYAQSGLVPECAMRVGRQKDGGNILPSFPATPCSCAFEKAATGTTDCGTCKVQGDCPSGTSCSFGYCDH